MLYLQFSCFPPLLLRGRLFQTQREKSIVALRDQLAEFLQVNVAAGNDCDNRSFARFPAQSCSNRERSSAFGDDARFLGKQSHRLLGFLESDNETAIYNRFHQLPHAREHALTASAIDKRRSPVRKTLRLI